MRKVALVGLIVVLAVMTMIVVGCGGDNQAKATLSAALDKVGNDISGLTTQLAAGGTGKDLKAALTQFGPDYEAVVAAAKNMKGADATAAEKAWTDLQTAVASVPDDATVIQAFGTIQTPLAALQTQMAALRKLAPSTTTSS